MSIYSTTTESNFNKPILNDELNYQKLQKFNKFYLTNSNFSCKTKTKIETSNKSEGLYNMNVPFSPKNTFLHSNIKNIRSRNYSNNKSLVKYKTYNNYNRMKNLFNPDILDAQYISKPKKNNTKKFKMEIPIINTFLCKKIKDKSLGTKIRNCIAGNLSKFIIPKNYYKNLINKSTTNIRTKNKITYKRNDSFRYSRLSKEKKNRKTVDHLIYKFKQKLHYDKRESLNEYNKFINTLQINLNLTKYRNSNKFIFE